MSLLETERALLMCMDPSHIEAMCALFHIDSNEALKWITQNRDLQNKLGFSHFNVFDKKSGIYIGFCGCNEVMLNNNIEIQLSWALYKEFKEDDIDIEVVFAVRNYMFKHFNISSLVAVISMSEPQHMNVAEAIDMENEYNFFEGVHKFYVYVVYRNSQKFKSSFGDGEAGAKLSSSRSRDEYAPSFVRNLRKPRPRPR